MKLAFALLLLIFSNEACAAPSGPPGDVTHNLSAGSGVPVASYVPVAQWNAARAPYSHGTGHRVVDPHAEGGNAWEATDGRDEPDRYMLYGPYVQLPPGDYAAFYHLERLNTSDETTIARLDADVDYGQNILNQQEVQQTDLPLKRYVYVPLLFHDPGGKLEVRLQWPGYTSLRVDSIRLFRVEGLASLISVHRAAAAVPSGLPAGIAPVSAARPFPDVFPRSRRPAPTLLVADIRKLSPSWQLLLFSLQGLVNRERPRLYLLYTPDDEVWLQRMMARGWVRQRVNVPDPRSLVRRFRNSFKGLVVTDPAMPATRNLATMIAGVENLLPAPPMLAKGLGFPVVADLRKRFHTNVAAYRWAFDHLWPRLNHHVIACSYPDHLGLRDYLVENRVFIFWISGPIDGARPCASPTDEYRLMEQLLARMPTNIPVLSYPYAGKDVGVGEGPGVTLLAEFGKYLVGSIDSTNLSVHSGIHIPAFHQAHVPPPPLREDRVYVSWIISDGDNLPVLTNGNFPQLWKEPGRGRFPIGWSISPSAFMLLPDVVDHYYRNASVQDQFVGAVSGIGYTYPDHYGERFRPPYREQVFDGFLAQTADYMRRMDLQDEWIMGITRPELFRRYAEVIPSLQALFPDYGRTVEDYADATTFTARGVPIFHAVTGWQESTPREEQIQDLVNEIRSITPGERPAFLHLFALNWFTDLPELREVLRRLGPEYQAVRPDQLAGLYREEMERERVMVAAPNAVAGVVGAPISVRVRLENGTAHSEEVKLTVVDGLRHARVTPPSVRIGPDSIVPAQISGEPAGSRLDLSVEVEGKTRRVSVALDEIPGNEIVGPGLSSLLKPDDTLKYVSAFQGATLNHKSGHAERDAMAKAPLVWAGTPNVDEPGHIAFGPYLALPAGRYLALFRLKRTGAGAGTLATVDVASNGAQQINGSRDLNVSDLTEGQYRYVPLAVTHPGGPLETRVYWNGTAPLRLDTVYLWRVLSR